MGKIALVTDSACDVSPQLQERYHLDIMSFSITVDGKSYVEREDFTADEYYAMLREAKGLPATAHITPCLLYTSYTHLDVYKSQA